MEPKPDQPEMGLGEKKDLRTRTRIDPVRRLNPTPPHTPPTLCLAPPPAPPSHPADTFLGALMAGRHAGCLTCRCAALTPV